MVRSVGTQLLGARAATLGRHSTQLCHRHCPRRQPTTGTTIVVGFKAIQQGGPTCARCLPVQMPRRADSVCSRMATRFEATTTHTCARACVRVARHVRPRVRQLANNIIAAQHQVHACMRACALLSAVRAPLAPALTSRYPNLLPASMAVAQLPAVRPCACVHMRVHARAALCVRRACVLTAHAWLMRCMRVHTARVRAHAARCSCPPGSRYATLRPQQASRG